MSERRGVDQTGRRRAALDWTLATAVAFVMIAGGAGHLARPELFAPLVPPWLPAQFVLVTTGVGQIGVGLFALLSPARRWAGLAFAVLCAGYLPLHLWDFFRADPVFQPPVAATVRVLIQGVFIWIGVVLWRRRRT